MRQSSPSAAPRRDRWTPQRQLRFLDVLARTRSVTRAAKAAGMSRESAYRLCRRPSGALFAAAWDRLFEAPRVATAQGHNSVNFAAAPEPPHSSGLSRISAPHGPAHRIRASRAASATS
jgi:hypothetical protein